MSLRLLTKGPIFWENLPSRIVFSISATPSKSGFRTFSIQLQDEYGCFSNHSITVDYERPGTVPASIEALVPLLKPVMVKQIRDAYDRSACAQQAIDAIVAEFPVECDLYSTAPKNNFIDKIWREVSKGLLTSKGKPVKTSFGTGRQGLNNYRKAIIAPVIETFKVEKFVLASPKGDLCQILCQLGYGVRDNMHALCCRPDQATKLLAKWDPKKLEFLPHIQQHASLRYTCWIIDGQKRLRLPPTEDEARWAAQLERMSFDGPDSSCPSSKEWRTTNRILEG